MLELPTNKFRLKTVQSNISYYKSSVMRSKRGVGRSIYRGWSREARDHNFFNNSITPGRPEDTEDNDRQSGTIQLLLPNRDDDEAVPTYRGWSRQPRDPAFFGSSSTSRRTDETDYSTDDVDRLSSGFQLLSYRDDDESSSNKEQRISLTSARDRRDLATRGSILTPDKSRKEQGPTILNKDANMTDGVKFVNDNMDVCDQLLEFLSGENSNYNVISAIGPQGAGKSTILSMIGGNNSQDMYRQYIFRPASREALESSRHQTTKINAYITKFKQIFLDCQASNCASVLDEAIRYSRSLSDGRYATNNYMEIVKLIAFLIQISHTLLVCSDWLIDIEMMKLIRTAEMFRANFEHVTEKVPLYNATRKINLVVLLTRAKSADFSSDVRQQRAAILRAFFSDSRRIRVSNEDEFVVFPLADIKPRKDGLSGAYPASAPVVEKIQDVQEVVDFDKSMRRLRLIIAQLPKDRFSTGEQEISEKQWSVVKCQKLYCATVHRAHLQSSTLQYPLLVFLGEEYLERCLIWVFAGAVQRLPLIVEFIHGRRTQSGNVTARVTKVNSRNELVGLNRVSGFLNVLAGK
ncbi:hypothetical protein DICVIV_04681 [Dictyocaulus viviparus]|uniref:Protein SMG9 n=1 Tax=Dictyocaulus viviparus TaxID=29172 RepID=A0A0D8XXH7_DICVI|nr:hypothetical protein DICVIV_04681 [Dictyocaulus viviparus]